MADAQRRKGLRGEAEVAAIWRANGFDVRGLEGEGDQLLVRPRRRPSDAWGSLVIHSEVKRQNRLRTAWIEQAEREAPAGAVPFVIWRPDGRPWWAMSPFEDLARLLA